jgi:hypothetical protein
MVSYGKYTFDKEPAKDATGKLYKCEGKKVYDTSYKLYTAVSDEQKKVPHFTLCTLATDDDNKYSQLILKTIDKIEEIWKTEHGFPFSKFKSGVITECITQKKNNYYDILDIMLQNLQHTFSDFNNFKIFLRDVLLKDTSDLGITINPVKMTEHVNAVMNELTEDEKKNLNSFVIISKIIKLVVGDILGQIFEIHYDYNRDANEMNSIITYAITHTIEKKDIKDGQTLLGVWCKKSIDEYVYDYFSDHLNVQPDILTIDFTNNILEYRNNLIKEYFVSLFNLNENEKEYMSEMLEPPQISIFELREQFAPQQQLGGSNRKPHTRINYINNKNMYYNL